jgi:hypothetical protein
MLSAALALRGNEPEQPLSVPLCDHNDQFHGVTVTGDHIGRNSLFLLALSPIPSSHPYKMISSGLRTVATVWPQYLAASEVRSASALIRPSRR